MSNSLPIPGDLPSLHDPRLAKIDVLIPQLDERIGTTQGLMREHLTAMRGYLLNSMPEEYHATVDMAKEILAEIDPSELQARLAELLTK